jgi:hypothetical protein
VIKAAAPARRHYDVADALAQRAIDSDDDISAALKDFIAAKRLQAL